MRLMARRDCSIVLSRMKSARFTSQTMNAAAGNCPCQVSSVVAEASNTSTLSRPWWMMASYARANIDQALLAIRGKRNGVKETLSGIVYNDCMLTYTALQDRPREFLAAPGLTHAEFARLLPAFVTAYALLYPPEKTLEGKPRQRRAGGGATGTLPQMEDKRLFILVFQKTNPLQTMHGLQFPLTQPQTNYWIHHLLPVWPRA